MTSRDNTNPPNKFCLNAAISACEKGGAWLEALELYEKMKTTIKPDFITMNSLLIALANADQKELAENIYKEALRDRILWPWKTDRRTGDRIMDLHQFSVEMSKIAVRNVIESFLSPKPVHDVTKDLILVVGKGYGSEDGIRMLAPNVMNLLEEEYCLKAEIDPKNEGRIIVRSDELQKFSDL
ncbi:hypothetical protein CTEN210_10797 [Chaetoceros tenuissimus]|uniref:Smr domain-containing protein n=1 Tax=Chaetoceros tenuissimus TaxID=426638 RepID=A0AAD3D038_9STRA|nr:hypothetical protein CTEN210_10797 [Chaetoceros tenuissimus]